MSLKKIGTSITSREIAKMTGKLHSHVMRDIRAMEETWTEVNQTKFGLVKFKDKKGEVRTEYKLSKTEALYVVSKYNDKIRILIINRLNYLETQFKERQEARLEYPDMTNAIAEQKEMEGKDTKPYHFSNEANLINRIVLGCSASKWKAQHNLSESDSLRDSLSADQIRAINHLQKVNTSLIETGSLYEDRKIKLTNLYQMRYNKQLVA